MNIIIISPEKFDSHTVSKHHYAITLSKKGHSVFFLNPPVDKIKNIEIIKIDIDNLFLLSSKKIIVGLRFFPILFRQYLERNWLHNIEKKIGEKIDIVWLFENSRFFDMRFAGDRIKIYHQVDLNQNFYPKIAACTADICFCVTDHMKKFLSIFNERTYKINHGFSLCKEQELTDAQCFKFKNNINAVYVGNFDIPYIDMDIIVKVVEKFHDIQFHFIGGCEKNEIFFDLLDRSRNIIWWGKVNYKLISSINKKADILLVAYQSEKYKKQVADSHKIMEYLSSGKVIVATYTDEYKDKRHLLEMVDNSADYINLFERVVNNLPEYNSQERQIARRKFAESNSYDKQIDKIFSLLKKHNLLPDHQ